MESRFWVEEQRSRLKTSLLAGGRKIRTEFVLRYFSCKINQTFSMNSLELRDAKKWVFDCFSNCEKFNYYKQLLRVVLKKIQS